MERQALLLCSVEWFGTQKRKMQIEDMGKFSII